MAVVELLDLWISLGSSQARKVLGMDSSGLDLFQKLREGEREKKEEKISFLSPTASSHTVCLSILFHFITINNVNCNIYRLLLLSLWNECFFSFSVFSNFQQPKTLVVVVVHSTSIPFVNMSSHSSMCFCLQSMVGEWWRKSLF